MLAILVVRSLSMADCDLCHIRCAQSDVSTVPVRCTCAVLTGGSRHCEVVMKMTSLLVQLHATGNMC
jgi:hypothetical protein